MNFKQLEAFYWAASCPSFAVAAQRVHVSVSSLSKRIGELEASLGARLFDRSGHRAILTPAGERLLPDVRDLLGHAERVRAAAATGGRGLAGPCRIGSGELASLTWVPGWLRTIRESHPQLAVTLTVDIGSALTQRLQSAELDVAVIAGAATQPNLQSVRLGHATFEWCAAPAIARTVARVDVDALAKHTLVSLPRGSGITHVLDEWMERSDAAAHSVLWCNQWGAVAGCIAAGMGIGMLPAGLARALQARKRVSILRARHALGPLEYRLHFRHGDPRALVRTLRSTCAAAADFSGAGPYF